MSIVLGQCSILSILLLRMGFIVLVWVFGGGVELIIAGTITVCVSALNIGQV